MQRGAGQRASASMQNKGLTVPTVWGVVEAVIDRRDGSREIVVKAAPGRQGALRVCAGIAAHTLIARGIQRASLDDIRVGEFVELTYHRNRDGLEAQSIYVRSD